MADEKINADLLPFSLEKQRAVLGHILHDERFFATVIAKMEAEWFGDAILCRIFDAAKKWYAKWKKAPSIPELLESREILKLSSQEVHQIRGVCTSLQAIRQSYQVTPLLEEMEIWLKARIIQTQLPKAAIAFNSQKLDVSIDLMNKMVKDYHDVRFLDQGEVSFADYGAQLIKEKEDLSQALTFGVTAMDRLIEPNGTAGCMMPGHMTLLLAPTNVGKTSALITIACANIMQGKSILFIAHEGTEEELKNKFMRCITGMNNPELLRAYLDPVDCLRMKNYELLLQRFLVYKPMFKAGLTVEEVASSVEVLQDQRRMVTGRGFDMLVDDYPAKLSCMANSKGNMAPRQVQEEVYNQFVQLGLRHKMHVLVAIQTNREGSRVNQRQGSHKNETRLLQKEDVMEAWGPITAAATVISLNRNDADAEMKIMTFALCKSRSGETGWAVVCHTDYDRCRTHSNDLGAFWYRGSQSLGKQSESIMKSWSNQLVPSEKIELYESLGT